ncbi:hypothetical protein ACIBG4_19410 [Nonomuraea sp. NPDC050383]|uniref:hypothetical protein n=1 Tax=Nonomuraea sp. NPDC050383 TaxID=3364362 RepID=UPI00378F9EEF
MTRPPTPRRSRRTAAWSFCPKCGWIGATLEHRPARGPLVLPWNPDRLMDVARPERLARHCTSCGCHWGETPLDAPAMAATSIVPTPGDADEGLAEEGHS